MIQRPSTAVPGRTTRAKALLEMLAKGPDFDAWLKNSAELVRTSFLPIDLSDYLKARWSEWCSTWRQELIDLQPELRVAARVQEDCLRGAKWPTDQPFLTDREFKLFVQPLNTCRCQVTLTHGAAFEGILVNYGDGSIGLNVRQGIEYLIFANEIADLVCIDTRADFSISAEMTLTHRFECPLCHGSYFSSQRLAVKETVYHCRSDGCGWTGPVERCFTRKRAD